MRDLEKSHRRSKLRSASGQAFIVLVGVIAFVVLPLLGFFGFEVGRLFLANQQLQNAADAAALTAVAQLASQDKSNPTQAHTDAMQAALKIFQTETVLGQALTSTTISGTKLNDPAANQSTLFFEFVDSLTGNVSPISDPNARLVHVYATSGVVPAFGKFLGIGKYNVSALSKGAVPQLDVILCYDVSGSMDDQTPVSCVRRQWDATLGKIVYDIPTGAFGPANGKIFDFTQPGQTGTSLNAQAPQLLTMGYDNANIWFSDYLASVFGTPSLRVLDRSQPDAGQPPGNYPPGTAPNYDGYNPFTDMVVNLDNNASFAGFTYAGYSFPTMGTLVEASRGNLENSTVFNNSKANTGVPSSVVPRAGYQKAYFDAAATVVQPMADAKQAALTFTTVLNIDTDAHFGFVAFDGEIGAAANSTEDWYSVDDFSNYGPIGHYALPSIPVDPTPGNTNFTAINTAISSCVPLGSTNIGAAVDQAVKSLQAHHRPDSKLAIILFTDGEPTAPGGPLDSDPLSNARMAAVEAKNAGIPIYTIGLAQNSTIVNAEKAILNDWDSNPTTGGMAAIAGNQGTFNLVTDSKQLRSAFEKIARRLVELVAAG